VPHHRPAAAEQLPPLNAGIASVTTELTRSTRNEASTYQPGAAIRSTVTDTHIST
jgi:hypothetical protein